MGNSLCTEAGKQAERRGAKRLLAIRAARLCLLLLSAWGLSLLSLSFSWGQEVQPRFPRTYPPLSTGLVRVPNLLGQTQNQAGGALARVRLQIGKVNRRTADQPRGTVVQQNPRGGALVVPGTTVDLWLAEPPEVRRVKVPDLRGQNRPQAADTLARRGLRLGRVEQKIDNRPAGTVIQQNPEPGALVPLQTPVNVWLAEPREVKPPPAKLRVPYLRGDTLPQASRTLERVRLRVGQVARLTADQTPGTVVRQEPAPGAPVSPGTRVDLWIAAPKPVEWITVPDLTGQTRSQANLILNRAALKMGTLARTTSDRTPGTVVRQEPGVGRKVRPGSFVHLWLAAAPPPSPPPVSPSPPAPPPTPPRAVTPKPAPPPPPPVSKVRVPGLLGKKHPEARTILAAAGLREGLLRLRQVAREADTVIEQVPEPGALVPRGTPVTLVIALQTPVAESGNDSGKFKWPAILAGLLALSSGGYYGARRLLRAWLLRAVQIRPQTDLGTQNCALDAPPQMDAEVRLKPVADPGHQTLKSPGALILEEGKKP